MTNTTDAWDQLAPVTKLNILAEESTVMPSLLLENEQVVAAVKNGKSKEDCLHIINENF